MVVYCVYSGCVHDCLFLLISGWLGCVVAVLSDLPSVAIRLSVIIFMEVIIYSLSVSPKFMRRVWYLTSIIRRFLRSKQSCLTHYVDRRSSFNQFIYECKTKLLMKVGTFANEEI